MDFSKSLNNLGFNLFKVFNEIEMTLPSLSTSFDEIFIYTCPEPEGVHLAILVVKDYLFHNFFYIYNISSSQQKDWER